MSIAKKKKVTVEEVLDLAERLTANDRLRVISRLAEDLATETPPKQLRKPIRRYAACGMWADREDMKDSVQWVRNLRAEEERRHHRE